MAQEWATLAHQAHRAENQTADSAPPFQPSASEQPVMQQQQQVQPDDNKKG
jgi:hypothetical protein